MSLSRIATKARPMRLRRRLSVPKSVRTATARQRCAKAWSDAKESPRNVGRSTMMPRAPFVSGAASMMRWLTMNAKASVVIAR